MGAAYDAAAAVTSALEARDYDTARSWLADGFTFHDPTSSAGPLTADEWIAANRKLAAAFPDLSYNYEIAGENGNEVTVRTHFTGTHSGDWDLSAMGGGVVPATNQRVETGVVESVGRVNDDGLIMRIQITDSGPGAGVPGLMQQLGIEMG